MASTSNSSRYISVITTSLTASSPGTSAKIRPTPYGSTAMASLRSNTGLLLCVLSFLCGMSASIAADSEEAPAYEPFQGERFDGFDWKMCKRLAEAQEGNVVVSPIGVKIVLAMLYEGSLGKTAAEIKTVLELPETRGAVRKRFGTILASLQEARPEYVLDIGTKLYLDLSVSPRERFTKILKTYYNSCVERIDFSKSVEAAMKINSWVEATTKGKIQNMVSEADQMSSKVLLLLNAIFFKGLWRIPFNPQETRMGKFTLSQGKTVQVPFMKITSGFYFYDSPTYNAKILRLPYQGNKYSMFLVLPNDPNGLDRLLNTITPEGLRHHMWLLEEGNVEVVLPKFSFKFTADLSEILKEMGIKDLFSEAAQLHGVVRRGSSPQRLYVSDVLQKAGLEVGEQGTTAYAVTEVSVVNKFGLDDYFFNASHPFLFYIEDEVTGTVIFVGRVVDPSKIDNVPTKPFSPIPDVPTRTPPKRPPTRPTPPPPRQQTARPGTPNRPASTGTQPRNEWQNLYSSSTDQ